MFGPCFEAQPLINGIIMVDIWPHMPFGNMKHRFSSPRQTNVYSLPAVINKAYVAVTPALLIPKEQPAIKRIEKKESFTQNLQNPLLVGFFSVSACTIKIEKIDVDPRQMVC